MSKKYLWPSTVTMAVLAVMATIAFIKETDASAYLAGILIVNCIAQIERGK